MAGVHGEKIYKLLESKKLPTVDIPRVEVAIERYEEWITALESLECGTVEETVVQAVKLLDEYKYYIDVDLIFDSPDNFLYRQKGQLKLDNTVMEEFLPILVWKCLLLKYEDLDVTISSQAEVFSSMHFESSLASPACGGGLSIKTKAQDFSIYRPLYIQASHTQDMKESVKIETTLGYACAELKTNLDKTMFQEASATAHDVRVAVTGAKYYLLADFLDMKPISTSTTDIEEILILRKAKRIGSGIRTHFATVEGRRKYRDYYTSYLKEHPYSVDVFLHFIHKLTDQVASDEITEEDAIATGWF